MHPTPKFYFFENRHHKDLDWLQDSREETQQVPGISPMMTDWLISGSELVHQSGLSAGVNSMEGHKCQKNINKCIIKY